MRNKNKYLPKRLVKTGLRNNQEKKIIVMDCFPPLKRATILESLNCISTKYKIRGYINKEGRVILQGKMLETAEIMEKEFFLTVNRLEKEKADFIDKLLSE